MKWREGVDPTGADLAKFDQIEARYGAIIDAAVDSIRSNELFKPTESNRTVGVMSFLLDGGLTDIDPHILLMYLSTALVRLADAPVVESYDFRGIL